MLKLELQMTRANSSTGMFSGRICFVGLLCLRVFLHLLVDL